MYVKEVLVQNKAGLHARPATFFIQKANEYKSTVWVEKEERRVNAKSLLGVLSLGIIGGTTIKVIADGSDETEAVDGLVALVESGFALYLLAWEEGVKTIYYVRSKSLEVEECEVCSS